MRRLAIILSVSVLGFSYLTLDNSLTQLGVTRDGAIDYISSSFKFGALSLPAAAHKIAVAARAEIATDMVRLAREWTESPTFIQWYSEYREQLRPLPPHPPQGAGEINSERLQAIRQLEETSKSLDQLPADQQERMRRIIDSTRQALMQEQLAMRPEQLMETDMANQQVFAAEMQAYNQKLAEWDRDYPENPTRMLTARLQAYLTLSDSVDFNAELTQPIDGKRLFVKPVYEQKSSDWKQCYRAGREANQAARIAVKAWLMDLR